MANTYTWEFPTLDTVPTEGDLKDVIKTIHWRVIAVSDSEKDATGAYLSASIYGATSAGEADSDFTAFDSITKDWCKARVLKKLGKTEDELKAQLDTEINNLVSPAIVSKTPSGWSA
tara:strand:- start:3683 stop:4033 length:351 start_codon:yes stop_codon:yes gene_type:complete